MASETTTTGGGGIGFLGLLTIVFITLKLTGHIAWSWIWVLSPLWIPPVCVAAIFLTACAIGILGAAWENNNRKNRRR